MIVWRKGHAPRRVVAPMRATPQFLHKASRFTTWPDSFIRLLFEA